LPRALATGAWGELCFIKPDEARTGLKLHLSITASQPFQPDMRAVSAVSQESSAEHPKALAKPLPSPDIILIADAWQPLHHKQSGKFIFCVLNVFISQEVIT